MASDLLRALKGEGMVVTVAVFLGQGRNLGANHFSISVLSPRQAFQLTRAGGDK